MLLLPSPITAQEPSTRITFPATDFPTSQQGRPVVHATLLGIGGTRQLETYLSPLEYRGPQFHVMHEALRGTGMADGRVSLQTLWFTNFAYTKPVVKAHGSCDAKGMKSAIAQAMKLVSSDLCRDLADKLADLPALETERTHE